LAPNFVEKLLESLAWGELAALSRTTQMLSE